MTDDMTSNPGIDLETDDASISPSECISISVSQTPSTEIESCRSNSVTGLPNTSSKVNLLEAKEPKKSYDLWFLSTVICLLMCVALAVCVAVLFNLINNLEIHLNKEIMIRKEDNGNVCLLCEDIKLGPFQDDNLAMEDLDITTENGHKMCCSKSAGQTSILLKLLLKRTQMEQNATNSLRLEGCQGRCSGGIHPRGVAAHLLAGIQQDRDNKGKLPQPIRNWIYNDAISHVVGVTMHNDRIRINSSGLYLVYSQVTHNTFYTGDETNRTPHVMFHYVYRFNVIYPNGGEQLLMKTSATECWDKKLLFGDYPTYTGSAIYLHVGDEIYVKVSDIRLLARDPKAVYFGLVKLS